MNKHEQFNQIRLDMEVQTINDSATSTGHDYFATKWTYGPEDPWSINCEIYSAVSDVDDCSRLGLEPSAVVAIDRKALDAGLQVPYGSPHLSEDYPATDDAGNVIIGHNNPDRGEVKLLRFDIIMPDSEQQSPRVLSFSASHMLLAGLVDDAFGKVPRDQESNTFDFDKAMQRLILS